MLLPQYISVISTAISKESGSKMVFLWKKQRRHCAEAGAEIKLAIPRLREAKPPCNLHGPVELYREFVQMDELAGDEKILGLTTASFYNVSPVIKCLLFLCIFIDILFCMCVV